MDAKKLKSLAVPFILTVSAVIVGLALYDFVKVRKGKKETEKVKQSEQKV
jgi:hypothetical protein